LLTNLYTHSGDVLAAADTGSITMFDTPQQFGEHCLDENFMHTITLTELYARRTCPRSSALYEPDVVSAGAAVLRECITALRDLVQHGRVTIELHHRKVYCSHM
jgi:hypothetical protein